MSGERRRQIKQILDSWWGNQPLQPLDDLAARIDAALSQKEDLQTELARCHEVLGKLRAWSGALTYGEIEERLRSSFQTASSMLIKAARERDEARAALAELEEEVRRMCVFGDNGDLILRRWQPRLVPRIAALLRVKEVPTP